MTKRGRWRRKLLASASVHVEKQEQGLCMMTESRSTVALVGDTCYGTFVSFVLEVFARARGSLHGRRGVEETDCLLWTRQRNLCYHVAADSRVHRRELGDGAAASSA